MTTSITAAIDLLTRSIQLRADGRNEAVLRAELQSRLRTVFPDPTDESWVNHYTEGAEAHTRVGRAGGTVVNRFIDTLVRSTVIEYESDLRQAGLRQHGLDQVREYVAGAVRSGTPVSQVRGVLSDTVEWYVYDAELVPGSSPGSCTPNEIVLREVETFVPTAPNGENARRLVPFLKKHLAREQSRPLSSTHIATDLGLDSLPYQRHVETLVNLVSTGRTTDTSIALATDLWSRFVDGLERPRGPFRVQMYVDEMYVAILSRLLAANVLESRSILSDDRQITAILNGEYFTNRSRLKNMVEDDYFGWLLRNPHLDRILPVAREIQRDLYAYDFARTEEEDLFGRLMAQLARRSQRKLLGQEWTPTWLARALASRCLDSLPAGEMPRIIDMCCGSGSILAQLIKEYQRRNPAATLNDLSAVATGFDVDPLAVMLSKTTWVVTLSNLLQNPPTDIVIPIYHADSLFVSTPVTPRLPAPGAAGDLVVDLDGHRVTLPAELIGPELRIIFDDLVDWAYDEARSAAQSRHTPITAARATALLDALLLRHRITLDPTLRERTAEATYALAERMVSLARVNRNGIWAFILRNTYRPGLLAGQFNGLVSNPPWLTMSQLADNPYTAQLSTRADLYGIKPAGASHLHLELATTFLLHAIDRYLEQNAAVACLVPGTIFNGHHHQKFRDAAYLLSSRPVPFELQEVWEIAPGTFKVRSAAVIGIKRGSVPEVRSRPRAFHADQEAVEEVSFDVLNLQSRTAWVLAGNAAPLGAATIDPVPPQGADLMPRTAVSVEIQERVGDEWRVRTPPPRSPLHFTVKAAKALQGEDFPGFVAPRFLYRMIQSTNLLPFLCVEPFAPVALPAQRNADGEWELLDPERIRTAGFVQTARRFQRINRALAQARLGESLAQRINERNKLSIQRFPANQYLVLTGAGGAISCAACLPVRDYQDAVIDQTLYWRLTATATEAWFRVGMLNSNAITEAIQPFVPRGEFGPRHLHTLPHRVIPSFDPANEAHATVADVAEQLAAKVRDAIAADPRLADPNRAITARRRRVRGLLHPLPESQQLEELCASILGTTPGEPL